MTLGPADPPPEAGGLDPNEWAAVYETPRPNGHQLVFRAGAEIGRRACLAFASPGERWLDVGCGTGHLAAALAAAGLQVTGVDADSRMIAAAKTRFPELSFETADASFLPFPDGSVDGIVATSVLGCLEDPAGFVAEAARVLRPAGTVVLTFTNRSSPLHAVGNLPCPARATTISHIRRSTALLDRRSDRASESGGLGRGTAPVLQLFPRDGEGELSTTTRCQCARTARQHAPGRRQRAGTKSARCRLQASSPKRGRVGDRRLAGEPLADVHGRLAVHEPLPWSSGTSSDGPKATTAFGS